MGFAGVFTHEPEALPQEVARWPQLETQRTFLASGLHVQWWKGAGTADTLRWNTLGTVGMLLRGELFEDEAADPLLRYEQIGPGFVKSLNGRFSGLLIDIRRPLVLLFNDRYGLGACHWARTAQGLYFASSARALRARLQDPPAMSLQSLSEVLSMGCVLDHRTLFQGIERLPPASIWTRGGVAPVQHHAYFSPADWDAQPPLPEGVFHRRMCSVLAQRVPAYLRGPQPVGVSLTGGLDGRLLMAWARAEPGDLHCYSFSGPWRQCADAKLARQVAHASGQPHQTLTVGADLLRQFPRLAAQAVVASDGLMDASGGVEIFVNQWARHISPVRLTGNWGSEILRGHVAFRPRRLDPTLLHSDMAVLIEEAQARYQDARQGSDLNFIAFKQLPWHHSVRLSLEEAQLTLRSPFIDNDIVALMHRAPPSLHAHATQSSLQWIHQGAPALSAIPTDRGLRLGGASLATQLDAWRQTFWVKCEYAMDYGMPRSWAPWLHRLGAWHPQRWVLGRHKFYHFRSWYQGPLATHLREVLLDPLALNRNLYPRRSLERMVQDHVNGRSNHTLELHRAWSYELLQQHLLSDPRVHATEALPLSTAS